MGSAWLDHVKKTLRLNPGKPLKVVLKLAKKTYKKATPAVGNKVAKKTQKKRTRKAPKKVRKSRGKKSARRSRRSRRR